MKIGIIGAGNIGSVLALHFRRLRHTVLIANSRGPETLSQIAQKTGAIPVDISESARGVDLLVITIPIFRRRNWSGSHGFLPAWTYSGREAGLRHCIWASRLCGLNVASLARQIETFISFEGRTKSC